MQVVQLFWFVLIFDLYLNCLQYGGYNPDSSAYSPIDPLNDFINSMIAAIFTVGAVMACGCRCGGGVPASCAARGCATGSTPEAVVLCAHEPQRLLVRAPSWQRYKTFQLSISARRSAASA